MAEKSNIGYVRYDKVGSNDFVDKFSLEIFSFLLKSERKSGEFNNLDEKRILRSLD